MVKHYKKLILAFLIPFSMKGVDSSTLKQPFPNLIAGTVNTFGFSNTAAGLGILACAALDKGSLDNSFKKVALRLGALVSLNVIKYCAPHVQTSSLALSMACAAGAVALPLCIIESVRPEKERPTRPDTVTTIKNLSLYALYLLVGGFMVYNYNTLTQPAAQ